MKPIVSLWLGKENRDNSQYLGSGVCVGSNIILTAAHVVKDHTESDIFAGLIPDIGDGVRVKKIVQHAGEDVYQRDIAIVILAKGHNKPCLSCDSDCDLSKHKKLYLQGVNEAENTSTELVEKSLKNWTDPGGWEFDTWPAKGMSGGAAVIENKLVGIIQARDISQNSGIVIPLSEVKAFVEKHVQQDSTYSQPNISASASFLNQIKENISMELMSPDISVLRIY